MSLKSCRHALCNISLWLLIQLISFILQQRALGVAREVISFSTATSWMIFVNCTADNHGSLVVVAKATQCLTDDILDLQDDEPCTVQSFLYNEHANHCMLQIAARSFRINSFYVEVYAPESFCHGELGE